MAALEFENSKIKYKAYIDAANALKEYLKEIGYSVDVQEDIELGATFVISLKGQKVATLEWNVPHYVTFESFVEQREKSFSVDYVKNLADWQEFLRDVQSSLSDFIKVNN